MQPTVLSSSSATFQQVRESEGMIDSYFRNFESLAKAENWKEIITQGKNAIEVAKQTNRQQDEAKICAQLTSSSFYLGEYEEALVYVKRCNQLSKFTEDPPLYIRALYLESAVHRALAPKKEEHFRQEVFLKAVVMAEEAAFEYDGSKLKDPLLHGKIFFNLGAAHADNPKGNLAKAINYYEKALQSYREAGASDDSLRTNIRLGKVYLLQEKYEFAQNAVDQARPLITTERIAMQADYLEAQIKFKMNDFENGMRIGRTGLERAKTLQAKEDEKRFQSLLNDAAI